MKAGYTKAYRKELFSDVWKMPPIYQRVFFYLRQKACWQPETFPTKKGFKIALNPGQIITSLSAISEGVAWYEYGVKKAPNKKRIKDVLTWLEGNAMVTVFSNRHGTFINIIEWNTYNAVDSKDETQNNRKDETLGKRNTDTLKEGKEIQEEKKSTKKKDTKKKFKPPTKNEVEIYFTENEYSKEAGSKAWAFYDAAGWKDSRGNQVKSWKQKMIGVWFKDENKIKGPEKRYQPTLEEQIS